MTVGLSGLVHTLDLIHCVKDGMLIIPSICGLEVPAFKVGFAPEKKKPER